MVKRPTFRHRAFIKENYVKMPGINDNYYVSGDGATRAFSATSGTHRSQLSISVNWTGGFSGVSKSIGTTKLYQKNSDGTYTLLESRTASSDGIEVIKRSQSSSIAYFWVNHDVSIPFDVDMVFFEAEPPPIHYSYNLYLYKNGSTAISGNHSSYPWHEIYHKKPNSSTWSTVYTFTPSGGPTQLFYNTYFGVE